MAEALKTFFSPALVERLADDLVRVRPSFPKEAFVRDACRGMDELSLLGRAQLIATALAAHLPPSYPEAIAILLTSLGPEHATEELLGVGMAPFFYMPHVLFVAERGLDHFELSMQAQYELTKRFSAESSIRAYIKKDPERTLLVLRSWTRDKSAHVRRLASEGTRLRLPWAARLEWLDKNPERVLELLELLQDDPSTLVRRSVANSLNDLGKVHPDLLIETCTAWLKGASKERRALVEHALRSAIKRADPRALALLDFGRKPAVLVSGVQIEPEPVTIGSQVTVRFCLTSTGRSAQALLVDLRVHFVKANGSTSPKVFKLKRVELSPGASVELSRKISLAVHTTRTPRPGSHLLEVVLNGEVRTLGSFEVVDSSRPRPIRAASQPRPVKSRVIAKPTRAKRQAKA